jgi:hypothetical protein
MIGKSPNLRQCHGCPNKLESRYTKGTQESALCQNSWNSARVSALDQTRAWKSPSNPNGLGQSFHTRAALRTPDKLRSPLTLRTSPLSLLYKNGLGSTIGGLNLTLFTLSTMGSTMVFIGGVKRCCG